MARILICGDSYAVNDPAYPGLHWSEQLLAYSADFEIINMAYGGCSNAMIALQLSQGLRFNPDFVIFSFTSDGRYEFDKDSTAVPRTLEPCDMADYLKRRYTTNAYEHNTQKSKHLIQYLSNTASSNFERIKNYFYIMYCLDRVNSMGLGFCYSLGGFEYKQDYTMWLNENYMTNAFQPYQEKELLTNLWNHGKKAKPFFHVDNAEIQNLFASQCVSYITGART